MRKSYSRTDKAIYKFQKRRDVMLSLFERFVIIVAVVVTIVDVAGFYAIKDDPERLTIPFIILMIVATIIPIAINFWYWLIFKQKQE